MSNKHKLSVQIVLSALMLCVALISCRKKNERYEGLYIGTERYTYLDSGATEPSIDTSYIQHIEITYADKFYTLKRLFNSNGEIFSVHKKDFDNHKHQPWNSNAYLEFSMDSMFLSTSSGSDYIEEWDLETWYFKGMR